MIVIRFIRRRGRLLLAAMLIAACAGCGDDGLNRAPVSGRVTVGDQPLVAGRIMFLPQMPNKGPTVSAVIRDGAYSLEQAEGPVIGTNRVEVEATPNLGFEIDDEAAFAKRGAPLPANPIPPEFNVRSTQSVDIHEGENQYNVAVPK